MPHCNICRKAQPDNVERASIRSNVRKFKSEQFAVWRCPGCGSIHATDEVDLAYYYREYPFHHLVESKVDWMLRAMYRKQVSRLQAAGLRPEHRVLDYGCGSGTLVHTLRAAGFPNTHGFDEYSEAFADRSVLSEPYDLIISQDVLEHVPEPWDFLHTLQSLVKPGGAVALGTPNASAIDLQHPELRVHTLHQPYHRHIFSKRMLCSVGDSLGWKLERYYPTMYTNTLVPFVNPRFLSHYFATGDDTVDMALEPIRLSLKLFSPLTLFWGLFGYFFAPEADVMAVYRA